MVLLLVLLFGCVQNNSDGGVLMKVSSVFLDEGNIPSKYSCDGTGVNPEIKIKDIPEGTKSIALIVDDPDVPRGTFIHWILFNIPVKGNSVTIQENSVLGTQGKNSSGSLDFVGMCPPTGIHRYYFRVYALNEMLGLKEGITRTELEPAMQGKILGQGILMGKYSRE